MTELPGVAFWLAVLQIILVDILLGADNAVVIALACRGLPLKERRLGIIYGTVGAIVLRVLLIAFALALLSLPYLKVVGGLLLIWIGVKVLQPPEEGDTAAPETIRASSRVLGAVRTVIMADLVMSVDNVLAIAAAAGSAGEHRLVLVIFGLLVSIPVIVTGSQLVLKLMDRFPLLIHLGGMLLGWIAGQMMYTDASLGSHLPASKAWEYTAAAGAALLVLLLGQAVRMRIAAGKSS